MTDTPASNFLIRGEDYLAAKKPGFEFVGRQDELNKAFDVLLRKGEGNNLILNGTNGVGLTSIIAGLQTSKDAPLAAADKSFFYLDVDTLFAQGNAEEVTAGFQSALATLKSTPNAVLVVNNTKGLLDGMRNTYTTPLLNALMKEVRENNNIQAIFETNENDIGALLDSHADFSKIFTTQKVYQPSKEDRRAILEATSKALEEKYGVTVTAEAVDRVSKLTEKYPGITSTMGIAQPKCSATILEGAIAAYARESYNNPPHLAALKTKLAAIDAALESGEAEGDLEGHSPEELQAIRVEAEAELEEQQAAWQEKKDKIRDAGANKSAAEAEVAALTAEIERVKAAETKQREASKTAREAYQAAEGNPEEQERIKVEYKTAFGLDLNTKGEATARSESFQKFAAVGSSEAVKSLEAARSPLQAELQAAEEVLAEVSKELNQNLTLDEEHVLAEFSRLSRIDLTKLQQDETQKLMQLEETLKKRVFGQDEAVEAIAKAVRRGKAGLKKPNKPIGTFLFLGPSGVGKTELAKAITEALFGDEEALHVYNMPEYSQENAITKMIGSPPGYEGYEQGGQLTNDMMRQPSCVNLFDEAEKAHANAFDILLRLADEGRIEDNHGREVFFGDSINIITSNIGATYFLDESLTFEEAAKAARADLVRHQDPNDMSKEIGFRPEFLNRLDGIFCFNRLDNGQIVMIAAKSIKELNGWLSEKGVNVEMPEADMEAMCKDTYVPKEGARGVMHYIADTITSDVSDSLLTNPNKQGTVKVSYKDGKVVTNFEAQKKAAAPKGPKA